MNAMVSPVTAGTAIPATPQFLGFSNVLRKDLREWRRGRRGLVVFVVTALWLVLTAASARINDWVLHNVPSGPGEALPQALPLDPLTNLVSAAATSFTVVVAVFATMSVFVSERESGTLAWTVSKPVSRTSVLLSKWLSASAALALLSVALPMLVTSSVVAAMYGIAPIGAVLGLMLGLAGATALYVAISLAAATIVSSQAGVAAIGLTAVFAPAIVTAIVPQLTPILPTSIMGWGIALAVGSPVSFVTPVAWLVGLVALFALARNRFARMEL
jgi:ABC-2 type transport system permease protein